MFNIVITGPESTGKSTLAKQLALFFEASFVDEFARSYLQNLNRKYDQSDLSEIAKGQIKLEEEAFIGNPKIVICDTGLEVIKIWSEYKYGNSNSYITEQLAIRLPDLYLLMTPDLPWQPDPLRENPENRKELFGLHKSELISSRVTFYEISGNGEERFELAKKLIINHFIRFPISQE